MFLLTIQSEVVVENLEKRKRLPSVRLLLYQNGIHVNCEEGPKYLTVFNQKIRKPSKGLFGLFVTGRRFTQFSRLTSCHYQKRFSSYAFLDFVTIFVNITYLFLVEAGNRTT